ncbi:MAG: hypothetical protein J6T47_01270 [Lachnospiraceae bacterium]|nr:hypothetical protein [Lachnospiraceae bacterium]
MKASKKILYLSNISLVISIICVIVAAMLADAGDHTSICIAGALLGIALSFHAYVRNRAYVEILKQKE